jgi:hypothetical protein
LRSVEFRIAFIDQGVSFQQRLETVLKLLQCEFLLRAKS